MQNVIQWLLEGPAWIARRIQLDLTGKDETDTEIQQLHKDTLSDPHIQNIISELQDWPGSVLKSHKTAHHPIHKLAFLADMGFTINDPGISEIAEKILNLKSAEGPFNILFNINPRYGGTGKDQLGWMLCDAPLLIYALVKFGLKDEPAIEKAIKYLLSLARDNGWPCATGEVFGKFRGPGRKADPCPYANLLMLKILTLFPELHSTSAVKNGVTAQLKLWDLRKETKPYLFGMGTDFVKLKAPLIWYDILHILDVLTKYEIVKDDPRIKQLVDIIKSKEDNNGRFTAESVWMAWKEWDFGQKKEASRWITFLALRIFKRLGVYNDYINQNV